MKVDLEVVEDTLRDYKQLDQAAVSQLLATIKNEAEARKPPREKKSPKPYVILVSDPEGKLEGMDLTGWTFQVEPEKEFEDAYGKLQAAASEFNASKKGARSPVTTVGEVFMHVSPKYLRAQGIMRKHKEPVFVRRTVNLLPGTARDDE